MHIKLLSPAAFLSPKYTKYRLAAGLPFAEDKMLVFVVLSEKCENSATVSLTLILTLISIAD